MIRHLVALRFKPGTSTAAQEGFYTELAGLRARLDGIVDFRSRANISVEPEMVRGFDDLFWFDFRDADARDAYLEDAEHQAIGTRLVAELEGGADGVFVCDFEV